MNKFKSFFNKLNNLPLWARILAYFITIAGGVISILLVTIFPNEIPFYAYIIFGLTAITLTYSVYISIKRIPLIKRSFIEWAEKRKFTRKYIQSFGFRTLVLSVLSLTMSFAFGVFNGYLGISLRSIWYGALATYYIFLMVFRSSVLVHHVKNLERFKGMPEQEKRLAQAKMYRNCGILVLTLNVALSSAIAQMIFNNASFSYPDWTIFAYAAYAFYKITMSIINLFKAKKENDLTVQAIRNINLTDACVSILALQTALLHAFSQPGIDISLYNTLTGIVISAVTIGLGIIMIIRAVKIIKNSQTEKQNG